jgi:hypothetical protein
MELNVLVKGKKEDKIFNRDVMIDAYPAVVEYGSSVSSMGIGLLQDSDAGAHGAVWGLVIPKSLMTSYRGMKVAEELKEFSNGALCECWYAGSRSVSESGKYYVDSIEAKIGRKKREEILKMVPPNLDQILISMKEKNIDFDVPELKYEMRKGRIRSTPVIKGVIDDYNRSLEKYRNEAWYKKISLSSFFHHLKI